MNPDDRQHHQTTAAAQEPEADGAMAPATKRSRAIRVIQIALTLVLIGVIVHGLASRHPPPISPSRANAAGSSATAEAKSSSTIETAAKAPLATLNNHVLPTTYRHPDFEGLTSLNDVPDYLQLHWIRRETRRYQLGLAARDALIELAITSDENR
ncbi:MAG: hypothetical protein HZA93_18675 [Verrucomicrobia bacterium]|nr:hypothetical protein [Verrucomicrobiota bacterium]